MEMLHFHQPGEGPGEYAAPPFCCSNLMDRRHTVAVDKAVHAERQRVVLAVLDRLDQYADDAKSVLTDPTQLRLVDSVIEAATLAARRTGCICPLIEVTAMGQAVPRYVSGGDRRCGLHGDRL